MIRGVCVDAICCYRLHHDGRPPTIAGHTGGRRVAGTLGGADQRHLATDEEEVNLLVVRVILPVVVEESVQCELRPGGCICVTALLA